MVVIRLSRGGAKRRPFYHVVASDSRNARDSGNYIERLGYYNPVAKGGETKLNLELERVTYWLEQGAKPSERVETLIKLAKKTPEQLAAFEEKKTKRKALKIEKAKAAAIAKATETTDAAAA
jgi:small subunit ribosomal protein S16